MSIVLFCLSLVVAITVVVVITKVDKLHLITWYFEVHKRSIRVFLFFPLGRPRFSAAAVRVTTVHWPLAVVTAVVGIGIGVGVVVAVVDGGEVCEAELARVVGSIRHVFGQRVKFPVVRLVDVCPPIVFLGFFLFLHFLAASRVRFAAWARVAVTNRMSAVVVPTVH